ncbi:hypothetical protein PDESU_04016 [Pontiella desulfatans]|uniref:PKD domain-containing protein n=1 Tax=Pontiella desulfatans TaxID=2750659 RepID=A0A6C2U6A3_PONDE|nr:BNR-4 repeat-containing protein [Pontiella desulfatans]VGO15433.1 hypothetical protein PDESU_04016 [Pontiella desulfatans]
MRSPTITTALLSALATASVVLAETLPLTDTAMIRGGTYASTVQNVGSAASLKNAAGDNLRIAMMKIDLTSVTGSVDTAAFNVYAKADSSSDYDLYAWAVKDTAPGQGWDGSTATFSNVTSSGMFTPQEDLHLANDPNLTLLGSSTVTNGGGSTPNRLVSLSNATIADAVNSRTDDGHLTIVFAIDANINVAVRPHDHADAPSLDFSYSTPPAPEFPYPLYAAAEQLYANTNTYDLTQENYTFTEVWRTQVEPNISFLPQSYYSPIVTRGDDTFVAYVDTDYRITVARISSNGVETAHIDNTLYQPEEFYANYDGDPSNDVASASYHTVRVLEGVEADSHHSLSLGIDENGYLHIVGDMHNYPRYESPQAHLPLRYAYKNIMYWRSDNPLDISSFSFKGDQDGECPPGFGFTYQFFFNDMNGRLHFTARAHQATDNSTRCAPFSQYDAGSGTWTALGGPDPDDPGSEARVFYDDGYEYTVSGGTTNSAGYYSKTHPHGVFDRNNTMHLVAPLLADPTLYPDAENFYHFVDRITYAQSTNGADFTKADGTSMILPATINLTSNRADIAYSSDGNTNAFLAMLGNIAVDYQNNPYTVAKHKYIDGTANDSIIVGWNGTSWINYGVLDSDNTDFRLVHDPAGVMSYIGDSSGKMMRFWKPDGSIRTINLPWSLKVIDYEYQKQTGNILGLTKDGDDLVVVKVGIDNRPGMVLVDPPTNAPTNNPPKITAPASAAGYDLFVAATDADGDPLTYTWSKSYGPGEVYFTANGTTASSNTTASFSEIGTYELKVAVSDGTDERYSTCFLVSTSSVGVVTNVQIGGLAGERDIRWDAFADGGSTATYTYADSTDPNLQFTFQVAAANGDALNLNSGFIGIDSSGRQTDDATGRISLDEAVTITVTYVDPGNLLAALEIDSLGPYWGNGATETTVFSDTSANSTNIVTFDHNIAANLIDYSTTGLDPLTKHNTATWSLTVSADHALGATATGMGGLKLKYVVDLGGNNTPPYNQWAADSGLTPGVNDGHSDDAEYGGLGDGMNNLLEYALGGDPLADDAAAILPQGLLEDGFLNYVYQRRLDAAARGLTYDVLVTTNLVSNVWTNGSEEAGSVAIDAEFESVTNRVPTAAELQQFMKLEVGISE